MYLRDKLPEVTPVISPIDEVSKCLLLAAQIIRKRGWCQLSLEGENGERCLRGAILEAKYGERPTAVRNPNDYPEMNRVSSYLGMPTRENGNSGYYYIVNWNNASGRTAAEVIAALESAALHN